MEQSHTINENSDLGRAFALPFSMQFSFLPPPILSPNPLTPIYGVGGIDLHKFSKYNEITE